LSGPDIFISYSREDAAVAQTYRDAFTREGFEVWWDQALRSGETYDEVTEVALRSAKAVVVLWSPRSVASRWVRAEATIADRNKTMVPVMIESCERPVMFELTQTADLSYWTGEARDMGWRALVDGLRHRLGRNEEQESETQTAAMLKMSSNSGRNGPALVGLLPISHRGVDEELEFLAEDLTEEITRELAQNSWFKMIAARKMSAFRDKSMDYVGLGRDLDAPYLIDGRLQRAGETVRLTFQLIDSATGSMLHSTRSSCEILKLVESLDEIAVSVGTELSDWLVQLETKRALNIPDPRTGWEHLLVAKSSENAGGSESIYRSLDSCRAAVAVAPELGMAHSMLASILATQVASRGQKLTDVIRQEMKAHAVKAQQLDSDNPAVLDNLIVVYATLFEEDVALNLAQRLVKTLPNSPKSYHRLIISLYALGRTVEAIEAYRKCIRIAQSNNISPVSHIYGGVCHYIEGQIAEAQTALDLALGVYPGFFLALKWKAIVATAGGDEPTGVVLIRRLRDVEPNMTLDMHVEQILRNPNVADRSTEAVEILRRLWAETEPGA
jgi:TolB-like protein